MTQRKLQPFGYEDKSVPILELQPDSFRYGERKDYSNPCVRLSFTDGSDAFFKRRAPEKDSEGRDITLRENRRMALSECGASVLSDLLGLDVVMKTEMVNLPRLPASHPASAVSGLGIVSDWVEHVHYSKATQELKEKALQDTDRLFQLYVYMAITRDRDQHDENIVISTPTHQLWSLDHEDSGSPSDMPLNPLIPFEIFDKLMGEPLPEALHTRLKEFIRNKRANETLLRAYYQPQQVDEIFRRAQYLNDQPEVRSLFDFYENARFYDAD